MATNTKDYDLQEAWKLVCGKFQETSGGIKLQNSPQYTPDEVLEQIRKKHDDDDKKNAKFRKTKEVIDTTLTFISLLGGIAAQGASMVFGGPSNLCMNAVGHVIQAGQNYKHIFSSLIDLFGRISDVLERCSIYFEMPKESIKLPLRRIINELLLSFVSICALSAKVLGQNKALTFAKVLGINSNEGVDVELANLARLVEREEQMRGTLGFESQKIVEGTILEINETMKLTRADTDALVESGKMVERITAEMSEGVKTVLGNEKKRNDEKQEEDRLKKINEILDNAKENFEKVEETHKALFSKQIENSGEWIKSEPLYAAWAERQQSSFSVLCIVGEEGYGKSFLFPTIIRDIEGRCSHESNDDLGSKCWAYFFFQQYSTAKGSQKQDKTTKGSQNPEKPDLLTALKVLAWQIAKKDPVYRKGIATSAISLTSTHIKPLWERLFSKSYRLDSTFFILLDGIDELDKYYLKELAELIMELKSISRSWDKFCLRIFFSGKAETIGKINSYLDEKLRTIEIGEKNRGDIQKFIEDRLSRLDNLTGNSAQLDGLRAEILEKLTADAHSDFVKIGLLINEIGSKQRPGEIREVLKRAGNNRSEEITHTIESLNESLSDHDISDVNTLLNWTSFAKWELSLEQLAAVLFLKNEDASLQPLSVEIQERYSALFDIVGEQDVKTEGKFLPIASVIVKQEIKDFLLANTKGASNDLQSLRMSGDVNEFEVQIVRRFLATVCDEKLFKKFDFDAFFNRLVNKQTANIEIEKDTTDFNIAIACIHAICSREIAELEPLVSYASYSFQEHMQAVNLSLISAQSKNLVGPNLIQIFTDPKTIKVWWNDDYPSLRFMWLYDEEKCDIVLKWLQDSAVTKDISERDMAWVKSLSSKSNQDADLMEHIASYFAECWLHHLLSENDSQDAFLRVYAYVLKIANRKDSTVQRPKYEWYPAPDIAVSQILSTADWAIKKLGLDTFGYQETRNVACTLRAFVHIEEAIEKHKEASALQPEDNWQSEHGLAFAYFDQKNWDLALPLLRTMIKATEEGKYKQGDIEELRQTLGEWTRDAGKFDEALKLFHARLKLRPDDYNTALAIMDIMYRQEDFAGILAFLKTLQSEEDVLTGLDRQTQLFHSLSDDDKYHDIMATLASKSGTLDIVREGYRKSIDHGEISMKESINVSREQTANMAGIVAGLMYYFAIFIYDHDHENEKISAISLWERVVHMEEYGDMSYVLKWAKVSTNKKLASIYFYQALNAEAGSEIAKANIAKLEQLSSGQTDDDWHSMFTKTYVKKLLARYFSINGQGEKSKEVLRGNMKTNLDILSDEDPENDWEGYHGLGVHLMWAGLDNHAVAAWSLITPTNEDEVEADPTKRLKGPLTRSCDGRCDKTWTYGDDIYRCRECDDIDFDEKCLKKLQEGTLDRKVCSKDHKMFHIPKYNPEENKRIGEGNVKVGEEVMKVDDWIASLRKELGLD